MKQTWAQIENALADFEGRGSWGRLGLVGKKRREAFKKSGEALADALLAEERTYPFEGAYLSVIGNVGVIGSEKVRMILERLALDWEERGICPVMGFGPNWAPVRKYIGDDVLDMHDPDPTAEDHARPYLFLHGIAGVIKKNPKTWLGDERLGAAILGFPGAEKVHIMCRWEIDGYIKACHPKIFGRIISQLVNTKLDLNVNAYILSLLSVASEEQIKGISKKDLAKLLGSKSRTVRERVIGAIGKTKLRSL